MTRRPWSGAQQHRCGAQRGGSWPGISAGHRAASGASLLCRQVPCLAVLQALAPFAETLEAQHIREDILPSFVDLTRDDQDSVRLIAGKPAVASPLAAWAGKPACSALQQAIVWSCCQPPAIRCACGTRCCLACPAVEAAGALAKVLSREEVASAVMPAAVQCAQDKSWRVRYNAVQQVGRLGGCGCRLLAREVPAAVPACCLLRGRRPHSCMAAAAPLIPQLPALGEALGAETASSELLPLYLQLLRWVAAGSAVAQGQRLYRAHS